MTLPLHKQKGQTGMTQKWTLKEAKEQYFSKDDPKNDDDYGLEDGDGIGIARRLLTMDVSIAVGGDGNGSEGISVILTPSDQNYNEEPDGCWNFSYFIPYDAYDMTKEELLEHIAKTLGIQPDERVWSDGAEV